jgi:DNA-binding transcriptional ArsR family regulator
MSGTPKTYRIARPREKRVLASAVRQNLLDTLVASREASAQELAAQMGMRVSALYYHLQLLERAGLVVRRGTRRGAARHEANFAPRATRIALDYGLDSVSGRSASVRLGRTLLRAAARDFAVGVHSSLARGDGARRNLWVSRAKAWLTDREIGAIHRRLLEIEELLARARRGPGKVLCAASWVLAPLATADESSNSPASSARQAR